ncbi:LLM class flavin-dependent oxidoreductase [Gynurincola endophyticus]|uniref:LLM class flavin-dependent oxidoreductase n=1 Tax=Gynurincola endophyticus TaxID=2479004 RepID=UPI000F8DAA22|nr:LLM class flavin-dependent oxidoreductase [Gynurincola endophyticus]
MKIGLLNFATGGLENMNKLVENLVDYSCKADELGFSRIWLGEHYYVNNTIWNNPEVLLPVIAGMTENIKVGAAGLLMSYHNPYRVALNFKLLANLFPGRIDLGFANGGVPEFVRKKMLPGSRKFPHEMKGYFQRKMGETVSLLTKEEDYIFDGQTIIPPYKGTIPSLWALSVRGAGEDALRYGINFSKSIFHIENIDLKAEAEKIIRFKALFFEKYSVLPEVTIAVAGLCHETSQKAAEIRKGILNDGGTISFNEIIGCPNYFFDKLSELQELFQVDEFTFLNKAYSTEDRILGLELLSEKFNLRNNENVQFIENFA